MENLPRLFLWAWERPEDFTRQTLPPDMGVAYLAATLHVAGNEVNVAPRLQPLVVPPDLPLIAVCRIEIDERKRAKLDLELVRSLSAAILRCTNAPKAAAVQIDFDALADERGFYKQLIQTLKGSLPASKGLSITALASWCMCDTWMQNLPIDETVPMCFSMGREEPKILAGLKAGQKFGDHWCYRSLGIAIDEPVVNAVVVPFVIAHGAQNKPRIYIYNSRSWSPHTIENAVKIAHGHLE
jgi:hypothetical protein